MVAASCIQCHALQPTPLSANADSICKALFFVQMRASLGFIWKVLTQTCLWHNMPMAMQWDTHSMLANCWHCRCTRWHRQSALECASGSSLISQAGPHHPHRDGGGGAVAGYGAAGTTAGGWPSQRANKAMSAPETADTMMLAACTRGLRPSERGHAPCRFSGKIAESTEYINSSMTWSNNNVTSSRALRAQSLATSPRNLAVSLIEDGRQSTRMHKPSRMPRGRLRGNEREPMQRLNQTRSRLLPTGCSAGEGLRGTI